MARRRPIARGWPTRWRASAPSARSIRRSTHSLAASWTPKVLLLCVIYFLNTLVTYGVFLWLPKILRDASGFDGFKLSAITAIPFVAALVGMVLIGRHSDRTGERKMHVAALRADRARSA